MSKIDMTGVTLEQVTSDLRDLTWEVIEIRGLLEAIPFDLKHRLKRVELGLLKMMAPNPEGTDDDGK